MAHDMRVCATHGRQEVVETFPDVIPEVAPGYRTREVHVDVTVLACDCTTWRPDGEATIS